MDHHSKANCCQGKREGKEHQKRRIISCKLALCRFPLLTIDFKSHFKFTGPVLKVFVQRLWTK